MALTVATGLDEEEDKEREGGGRGGVGGVGGVGGGHNDRDNGMSIANRLTTTA